MALIDVPVPFVAPEASVEEAWIDYNGHMNVAYYIVLFDRATDHLFDHLDIGGDYRAREGCSFFTVESRTSYVRELTLGDSVTTSMQIIDHDDKRLHTFQQMYHATDGFLAATLETLFLHIDMDARKAVPWSRDVDERIRAAAAAHRTLPPPERLGRPIGIQR